MPIRQHSPGNTIRARESTGSPKGIAGIAIGWERGRVGDAVLGLRPLFVSGEKGPFYSLFLIDSGDRKEAKDVDEAVAMWLGRYGMKDLSTRQVRWEEFQLTEQTWTGRAAKAKVAKVSINRAPAPVSWDIRRKIQFMWECFKSRAGHSSVTPGKSR